MGLLVLALLLLGFYWLAQNQWAPRWVAGTPGNPGDPHATPPVPATSATPGHLEWASGLNVVSLSSVPGAILVGLAVWIFWVMFFAPTPLKANQTRFLRSSSQWTYRPAVGEAYGDFVLDPDAKAFVKEVAKQVHDERNPGTKDFNFVPDSARFVIRPVYDPMSWFHLEFYEVECVLLGKATWKEETVDPKGVKTFVDKSENAFSVRGYEEFSGWKLDNFLTDYDFIKTTGGAIQAAPGRKNAVNRLFGGALKQK